METYDNPPWLAEVKITLLPVRCAQAASILTSINEKLQAAHVADVDKGTLIADVAMLKAFTAAGASLDEISPVLGAINALHETYVGYTFFYDGQTDAPPSAFFEALTELEPDAWIAKVKESIDARFAELAMGEFQLLSDVPGVQSDAATLEAQHAQLLPPWSEQEDMALKHIAEAAGEELSI